MFDIAEMRILSNDGTELKFANFRQTYAVNLNDTDPFFTSGILLQTDDVTPGKTYTTLKIYIRKIIFNNATQYTSTNGGSSWVNPIITTTIFAENTANGYDITTGMVNTYWDTLRIEAPYVNEIFPLSIPITGGLNYSLADSKTVLEIRFLVKNFIKKFEYVSYPSGVMTLTHYWAFSDQLRNVYKYGTYYNELYYSGNLLAVARSYVPVSARTLTINGTAANKYILLVPNAATSTDYIVTTDARTRALVAPCDFPKAPLNPGSYIGPLMDYYLNYEKYKIDYVGKYATCGTSALFQSAWDDYNTEISKFKMPVAALFTGAGGAVVFTNLKPAVYDVYYTDNVTAAATYGKIFNSAALTKIIGGSPAGTVDLSGGNQSVNY
jgi:hypothetical protein